MDPRPGRPFEEADCVEPSRGPCRQCRPKAAAGAPAQRLWSSMDPMITSSNGSTSQSIGGPLAGRQTGRAGSPYGGECRPAGRER